MIRPHREVAPFLDHVHRGRASDLLPDGRRTICRLAAFGVALCYHHTPGRGPARERIGLLWAGDGRQLYGSDGNVEDVDRLFVLSALERDAYIISPAGKLLVGREGQTWLRVRHRPSADRMR
jgi:hypothetical protein